MKSCLYCERSFPPESFYSDRSRPDGLSNGCRTCTLAKRARYREANRDKLRDNARADRRAVPERGCWQAMLARCYDNKNRSFKNYGGRGIGVCERWRESFDAFLEDMGRRPSPRHTVDRADPNGNYEPSNCRWATPKEQARNMRRNHVVTAFGKAQCLAAWSEELGVPLTRIRDRLRLGWDAERALSEPAHPTRPVRAA